MFPPSFCNLQQMNGYIQLTESMGVVTVVQRFLRAHLWEQISCLKLGKVGIALDTGANCRPVKMVRDMFANADQARRCEWSSALQSSQRANLLALQQCMRFWSDGICTQEGQEVMSTAEV